MMVKNCCVVGCHNLFIKGKISFYRCPLAEKYPVKQSKWIAAVKRDYWIPNSSTRICSEHFVTGKKNNDLFAPNYIPMIFPQSYNTRTVQLYFNEGKQLNANGSLLYNRPSLAWPDHFFSF